MFVEVHSSNTEGGIKLAFIKSLDVQAFPCGRRRSELVTFDDTNSDGNIENAEHYYIPYDPEARLNTEANNRKHSSINGFTQNYIKSWDDNSISLGIGGYLFKIKTHYTDNKYHSAYDAFGSTLTNILENTSASIYANIRIDEVPLYSGFTTYYTSVLRDQATVKKPATVEQPSDSIDRKIDGIDEINTNPKDCFYFAGLSFSLSPLTGNFQGPAGESSLTKADGSKQRTISLRILDNIDGTWKIHQPALLPNIEHGDTENSIKVGTVYADNILCGETSVPTMTLEHVGDNTYRLKFSAVNTQ